jgi:ABC-type dipeptide/oligopeptide/nickel transport system permease component
MWFVGLAAAGLATVALLVGVPLGMLAASRPDSLRDRVRKSAESRSKS